MALDLGVIVEKGLEAARPLFEEKGQSENFEKTKSKLAERLECGPGIDEYSYSPESAAMMLIKYLDGSLGQAIAEHCMDSDVSYLLGTLSEEFRDTFPYEKEPLPRPDMPVLSEDLQKLVEIAFDPSIPFHMYEILKLDTTDYDGGF